MLKTKISKWIDAITQEGDLPSECLAIYIGLFEGGDGYQVYFTGSTDFDPDDEDWACPDDTDYEPKNKYLSTGISTEIDWEKFKADVVSAITAIRSSHQTILSQTRNIGIGFDSGDITIL